MVGDVGIEPTTSSVWRKRSPTELIARDKLLEPVGRVELPTSWLRISCSASELHRQMVSRAGFEPATRWLRVSCSTNWANGPLLFAPERIRTSDPRLRRPMLYPLSYRRIFSSESGVMSSEIKYSLNSQFLTQNAEFCFANFGWGEWGDLNPQHLEPQSSALTNWATLTVPLQKVKDFLEPA